MWAEIELREIRIFLTLADELHFGRTADRLQVTSSYVSQTLRTLETRIGGRLFARTSRRVSLTPLGRQLLSDLQPAYAQLQSALASASEAAKGIDGVVKIGTYVPGLDGGQMIKIARAFEERYPRCSVAILDIGVTANHLDRLRSEELDLLIMRLPISAPDIAIGPILTSDHRVVAVASNHPLAAKQAIDYEELGPYKVTDGKGLPREMLDALIPPRTPSGRLLARANITSVPEALMRAATGELVHITVPSVLEQMRVSGLVAIPIRDLPPSQVALIWLQTNHSPRLRAFIDTARDTLTPVPT